ncbi:MAG: ABC transporter substrate-binding protein [Bacilli bacterium]|jgi:ABC-type oligopeptide transport system substrate-binding subunit
MKKSLVSLTALFGAAMVLAGCGATSSTTAYEIAPEGTKKSWAEAYDTLIASAKADADATTRSNKLHEAEDMIMDSGAVCPIYVYTDQYLMKSDIKGFFDSPLGYKFFYDSYRTGGGKKISACIASEPQTIDPALNSSVDGATYIANSFVGLYQFKSVNGVTKPMPALSDGEPVKTTLADGKVKYDFTLKASKWSDGTDLTANDFVYAWNRAASGATASDYAYIFDVIDGAAEVEADETGTKKLNISASEDGTHFYCTTTSNVTYFDQLLAFPTYAPVKQAAVETSDIRGGWASDPTNYVCNGAFKLSAWTHKGSMTYVKNDNYYDAANVQLDELDFVLNDNDTTIYSLYESTKDGIDLADSFPTENIDQVKAKYLKTDDTNEYYNKALLGTYYIAFNVNSKVFTKADTEQKRADIRNGLSLLIDRNYLVNSITKGDQIPANSFVPQGTLETDGTTDFTTKNGKNRDGKGYFSVDTADRQTNIDKAIELIKGAGYTYDATKGQFTDFPSFDYLLNNSSGHVAIASYIQSVFAQYGITMNQKTQEWATFLATRKAGDFDVSRDGWNGDYNDAMTFLDMFLSTSGNNDCQLGKDAHANVKVYDNDL